MSRRPRSPLCALVFLNTGILTSCLSGQSGLSEQRAVTAPATQHADLDEVTPPRFDTEVHRDVVIPLRDGTKLVADITMPVGEGPWPTILARTPYGRDLESPGDYAKRGYAFVVQACRGRDGSEGVWGAWEDDKEDGYDTINWIVDQTWSDGKVCMRGGSYLGQAQILAAASGHPALKCIVPISPGSDGFSDFPFRGGVPMISLISYFYLMRGPKLDRTRNFPPSANNNSLKILPLTAADDAWAGQSFRQWDRFMQVEKASDMPTLDIWDEFARLDTKVAGLHIGGIWDPELTATRRNFYEFNSKWSEGQYFVFGPWPHNVNQSRSYADQRYGKDSVIDLRELGLLWYEHWLKGKNVGLDQIPRVQVFATGANRWLALSDWPAGEAVSAVFHLDRRAGNGDSSDSRGMLASSRSTQPASLHWKHDPNQAVGGNDVWFGRSTRLWYRPEDGDNVLFVSEPFAEDTLLSGPAEVAFWLSSDALDTDVFCLLAEIDDRGVARALHQHAALRVRYRDGFNNPKPLQRGVPQRVVVPLADFAHLFRAGHRLGLAIRSDLFPAAARNLGTMEPYATGKTVAVQQNRIHMGPAYPGRLQLSRLPTSLITSARTRE